MSRTTRQVQSMSSRVGAWNTRNAVRQVVNQRRPRSRSCLRLGALLLTLFAAGCSEQQRVGQPYLEHDLVCRWQVRWFCPTVVGPGADDPDDPSRRFCAAMFANPFLGLSFFWGSSFGNGATRITIEYDDAGRPVELITDCGAADEFVSTIGWHPDGRLDRYRSPAWQGDDLPLNPDCRTGERCAETVAIYGEAGGLTQVSYGTTNLEPFAFHDFELEELGRITRHEYVSAYDGLEKTEIFEYSGERLVRRLTINDGVEGGIEYSYDEGGRVLSWSSLDTGMPFATWTWGDQSVVVEDDEFRSEVDLDSSGRPVELRTFVASSGEQRSVVEWTWRPDGLLQEVFYEEWGW